MENKITDLTIFEEYQNRQVVLNYYEDEDFLFKRDGFHFKSIKVLCGDLLFSKMDGSCCTITFKNYSGIYIDSQFPNYYILRNGIDRLEFHYNDQSKNLAKHSAKLGFLILIGIPKCGRLHFSIFIV